MQLTDIIDVRELQSLMDDFYKLTRVPMSLLDLNGTVLAGAGWQKICTKFHREHPETLRHCIESDTQLTAGIREGEHRLYKCMNNMWDAATPLMAGGKHMGHLFTGQFFFADELPDYESFRAQAARYGFPEEEYLAAIDAVPRLSRSSIDTAMSYLMKFAAMISQLGYSNITLTHLLTERESLIHSLGESQQRLARGQKIAHLGSWEFNRVNNDLTWSDEVYRIFGLQPQEFGATYEAFLEAVHPEDRSAVEAAYSGSLREGRDTYEIEHRVVRKSGEIRHVHEKCEHFRDDAGRIIRSVGMVHDVTERKQAEVALRESELSYRQILDSIPGMVFTTRPDGYCDYQSQQWVDFTGVPMSEHFGDGWNKLLHPDDRPLAFAAWRNAVEERAPYDLEYRVRRQDGEYEWFKVCGRPIRNEAGEIVRWFGTVLNIDQLVRTQEELRQAKAMAEEANRAKSEFLANMSHEIRTPMTVFVSAIEQLLRFDENPEGRQLLRMADRSARRLRRLIEDILDLSRIEARRFELEEEPFDLPVCVREAVDIFSHLAREKNLRLETEIAPDTPHIVVGDPHRLGQVLINLVGNAIKFTDQGEIRVSVRPRGDLLEIAVADTGIGIPAEKREMIFQVFRQVDSSFTRRFGGTGLGLTISKGLIDLMGGELSVQSREGEGSVFTVTVSLKTAEKQSLTPTPASDAPKDSETEKPTARILLAEDDFMIREMFTIMLAKQGWHLETAESGKEAVEKSAEGDFDLILMDLQMPVVNGIEATRAIRERELQGGKRTCIIGLTAHAHRKVHEECVASGMDKVLTKPIEMKDLILALGESSI